MANSLTKLAIVGLTGALLIGTAGSSFAQDYRYGYDSERSNGQRYGDRYDGGHRRDWHHRGLGVGGAVAAGVLGGAALGAATGAYAARPAYGYPSGDYEYRGSYDRGY